LFLTVLFLELSLELFSEIIFLSVASLFTFAASKSPWGPVDVSATLLAVNDISHAINFAAISSHSVVSVFSVAEFHKSISFGLSSLMVAYNLHRLDTTKGLEFFVKSVFIGLEI